MTAHALSAALSRFFKQFITAPDAKSLTKWPDHYELAALSFRIAYARALYKAEAASRDELD